MTTQSPHTRGPERFALPEVAPERRSPLRTVGAGLALLALVVGVPLLLLQVGPLPIPTSVPTLDTLTQPITTETLLTVLLAIVWLAWLQFVVCTAIETIALIRGGGLPRPVPLSGRSQALARALVGTFLIGTTFLGNAANAASSGPEPSRASTVAAPVATGLGAGEIVDTVVDQSRPGGPVEETSDAVTAGQADEGPQAREHEGPRMQLAAGVPADMRDVVGKKVAIVQPPEGHYHDNLWDISERHLGEGRRWREIYDLNKGRQQPDGGQLVLGRLIQPGWVLIMPEDATGVERITTRPTTTVEEATGGAPSVAEYTRAVDAADATVSEQQPESALDHGLLAGGLLGGMVLTALLAERHRRRSRAAAAAELEAEVALRAGADQDRVAWLDRSLRGLAASCRAQDLALPPAYAATVSDDAIELLIAPGATAAPTPWSVEDEGRRWKLHRDADEPAELGHAPYPGLVCLGRDGQGVDVLLDLESVGGIVSLTGSGHVAPQVVSALAVQLATAPWAEGQQVHGFQLADAIERLGGDVVHRVEDLWVLLDEIDATRPARAAQDVLSGRLGRQPGEAPAYVVLGGTPDAESAERLAGLTQSGQRGVGVVSAGSMPGARWQLTVDDAGRLQVPLLDLDLAAVRLTDDTAMELAGLIEKARTEAPPELDDRPRVPSTGRRGDDAHWSHAPVRVGLLGPLELRAAGQLDPSRVALATEVVTFLAVQTAPVHPSVVAASVWPRGVTPEVRDATIARVRDWLGVDADGNHLLRENDQGRIHLADDIAVDWQAFCDLARRSRNAVPRDEKELLRRALQLVRGEVLQGRDPKRYSWLARTRLEERATDVVVDAAHRLAVMSLDDDPGGASAAAGAGLRIAPTAQLLWQDLLRAEARRPDGPGAGAVADQMVVVLQQYGAPLDATTEALVDELLPMTTPGASTGA